MNILFEHAFKKSLEKHSSIKKQVENKVRMIITNPVSMGEPLKGNWRGFYSCPVKKNFIIIYLYCYMCRKKGDSSFVNCSDCATTNDNTIKFVLFETHDKAYGI